MKYLFYFIPLFCSLSSSAQKLHFTNNTWSTTMIDGTMGSCPIDNYGVYSITGDTLIGGKDYKIISGGACPHHYTGYVREDTFAGMVYININDTERILYNYNLHLGDTIHFAAFDSHLPLYIHYTDSVIKVDSTMINGVYHKIFSLVEIDSAHNTGGFSSDAYIEGIGSVQGPLYPVFVPNGFEFTETLRCFYDDTAHDIVKAPYHLSLIGHPANDTFKNNCTLAVSHIALLVPEIKISPNPAFNIVNLAINNMPSNFNCSYSINDITGRQLKKENINSSKQQIDISNLQPGIYLITINLQNKIITEKLVKE
jgi:hypothetical protein